MEVETNNDDIGFIRKEPEQAATNNNIIQNLASKDSNQEKLILNDVSLASAALDVDT